ncbi:hypothetical protein CSOJ01_01156 [Colletotrichum sojae]|uniref:Uncharacterized protein n=1 Tax=Colletotrichum sojae TaxID=2175907 RepID=A0A8H6JUT9_9PEZI|nr:hypothetical protein CSOJ01_01156 [Colletotrichum sojae]
MATLQLNGLRYPGRAHRDPCCREGDGRRVNSVGEPASRRAEVAQTALAILNRFSHAAGVGSRDPCAGPRAAGEGRSPGLKLPMSLDARGAGRSKAPLPGGMKTVWQQARDG